ncbi:MAG TPA: sporulation protein YtxC [Chondromyces sp.]|nr:sporulation protein YtxC [Chondromyces sp.]
MEILFKYESDARKFGCLLKSWNVEFSLKEVNNFRHIQYIVHLIKHTDSDILLNIFIQFILSWKKGQWAETVLKERFYYSSREEREPILEMFYDLSEGNRSQSDVILPTFDEQAFLTSVFYDFLHTSKTISFDSFVMFRMKPYLDYIYEFTALSIDEYKMEQEYQVFVDLMRKKAAEATVQTPLIHLLHKDGELTMYDWNFRPVDEKLLMDKVESQWMKMTNIPVKPFPVLLLVSLSPLQIYYYSETGYDQLGHTLTNIFQERTAIFPVSRFYEERRQVMDPA